MPELTFDIPQIMRRHVWRYGRPAELWLANARPVAEFIERAGLTPVEAVDLVADDPVPIAPRDLVAWSETPPTEVVEAIRPKPFPGGKRTPHVHFRGEFYALDDAQWAEFSSMVLDRYREKLASAKTVPFTALVELGEAFETM